MVRKFRKFVKFAVLSAVVATVGMLGFNCAETTEPGEDETTYKVTLKDVGSGSFACKYGTTKCGTEFAEGDTVEIDAGVSADEFLGWSFSTTVSFYGSYDEETLSTVFIMPGKNVTATANWDSDVTPPNNKYTVSIQGGAKVQYSVGTVVELDADDEDADGNPFVRWVVKDADTREEYVIEFEDEDGISPTNSFRMIPANIEVWAYYDAVEFFARVQFTWEAAQQGNISSIDASVEDVANWLEIYNGADYVEEDATEVPLYTGNPQVTDHIYSSTLGSTANKSKYWPSAEGMYTAVCTVEDEFGIMDIVANYEVAIIPDGDFNAFQFIEVGFDVAAAIADDGDDPWIEEWRDNPFAGPTLQKAKAKKLVKKIVKDKVTYYILHRAKK